MARIDNALASVENPDVLTKILLQTGAFHRKIPDMFRVSQGWQIIFAIRNFLSTRDNLICLILWIYDLLGALKLRKISRFALSRIFLCDPYEILGGRKELMTRSQMAECFPPPHIHLRVSQFVLLSQTHACTHRLSHV